MPASQEMLKTVSKISVAALGTAAIGAGAASAQHEKPAVLPATDPLVFEPAFPPAGEGHISHKARAVRLAIREKRQAEQRKRLAARLQQLAANSSSTTPLSTSVSVSIEGGCGDNPSAHFIYENESSCSTTAQNSGGCTGIGQDCNGELQAACPSMDYSCENQFFTNYAYSRYGGWEQAEAFWKANGWW
jgi:type II secretory pathway pseudopilin PulG